MFRLFQRAVPFLKIRHNDLPCYVNEGYGGRPIEEWPVYSFFCLYLNGEKEKASEAFTRWYRTQLEKYHAIPSEEGGMYRGSLYRLIEDRSGVPFSDASEGLIQTAIRERVEQRFALLTNIQQTGYDQNTERIDGVQKRGLVYLKGGHHRAAAVKALGKHDCLTVFVFPNQFIYNCFCLIRTIKHAIFQK